jgi:translation elongation factor EF-1beta
MSQAPVIASQPPVAASQSAPALLSQHKNGGTSATTAASQHSLKTSLVETTRPPPSVDPRNAGLSALTLSIHPKFPVRPGNCRRRPALPSPPRAALPGTFFLTILPLPIALPQGADMIALSKTVRELPLPASVRWAERFAQEEIALGIWSLTATCFIPESVSTDLVIDAIESLELVSSATLVVFQRA